MHVVNKISQILQSSFRYTYIVSNEDAFVSARCGYLCKVNIVCFPKKKTLKKKLIPISRSSFRRMSPGNEVG